MDKVNLSELNIEAVTVELSDDIIRDLKLPIKNRRGFKYNSYTVTIPRYFYRFIGIRDSEDSYYDFLYRLERELKIYTKAYKRFDKGFDRSISLSIQNKINEIWNTINNNSELDIPNLINVIDSRGMFPSLKNFSLADQIKNYFKVILDYYVKTNSFKDNSELKLIISYSIYWMNLYFKDLFKDFKYDMINPKLVYFGQITREEAFFLVFLSALGCDILYYNPENSGAMAEIDKFNVFSREIEYITRAVPKEFPKESTERIKTSAYSAREELHKNLFDDKGSFYRPWQFVDYNIQALTMRTTYEEINLWIKEKAMIRDGWKVEDETVFIPNIFAKVSGVHEDIEKYWKEINEVARGKKTIFINKFPMIDVVPLEYGKLAQVYPEDRGAEFEVEKLIRAPWWKYKELRLGLQKAMANRICAMCLNPPLYNADSQELRDVQADIFSMLINLPKPMFQLLQNFDYPEEIPRIVLYNNEKNGNLSYEDCIMLTFMNFMGVDIVIYNPSGYNDIETYIYPDYYDVHHLEKMTFNLNFQKYEEKKGFFKNLFKF